MKPIIFAVLAMICYAVANLIVEEKFSKYNNLTVIVCYAFVIFSMASLIRYFVKTHDPSSSFPTGSQLVLVIILGLVFCAADYFYIGAYTNGGNLITITCITVMFPVFASLLKFTLTRSMPNIWQITGYFLAATAVLLVAKGSVAH